ncbi:hypothetical protein FPV67DRAFT_1668859 [Lyophyllum atratum]|nr:hypothetical protein FPV67DRAFT_1668859 [Lyophyllum atratum]
MPPPPSLKRKRRDPAALRGGFDSLQLDFLAGLRIVEQLGTARPTKHDSYFEHDDELISSLNWISLLLETDSSAPQRDIAVALSAEKGRITIHLAKANAQLPTREERGRLATLMRTLRLALQLDNCDSNLMANRFTDMMSGDTLPEISRKLHRIGTVQGRAPEKNWEHFLSLLPIWRQSRSKGERSPGFIQLAKRIHGVVHGARYANAEMIDTMKSFILYDQGKPIEKMNAEEKSRFTTLVMVTSALMISSDFFNDLITPGARFHEKLDHDDLIFMYEVYRRIYDVARYWLGCSSFSTTGIPFLAEALDDEGIDQFLRSKGGITVQWIVRSHRQAPRTYYWAASPEVKVRRLLGLDALALEAMESHYYDNMAQREEVTSLWTKGKAVTPILHSELQLIQYLERRDIPVVECGARATLEDDTYDGEASRAMDDSAWMFERARSGAWRRNGLRVASCDNDSQGPERVSTVDDVDMDSDLDSEVDSDIPNSHDHSTREVGMPGRAST